MISISLKGADKVLKDLKKQTQTIRKKFTNNIAFLVKEEKFNQVLRVNVKNSGKTFGDDAAKGRVMIKKASQAANAKLYIQAKENNSRSNFLKRMLILHDSGGESTGRKYYPLDNGQEAIEKIKKKKFVYTPLSVKGMSNFVAMKAAALKKIKATGSPQLFKVGDTYYEQQSAKFKEKAALRVIKYERTLKYKAKNLLKKAVAAISRREMQDCLNDAIIHSRDK